MTKSNPVIQAISLTRDSIENAFTRLGTAMDKHRSTMPSGRGFPFNESQMDTLYYDATLMRRIVDRPARDALKRGFEVRFEDDDDLQEFVAAELKRLRAVPEIRTALKMARKNGGAGIVIIDETSGDLRQPRGMNVKITRLRAHSRWSLGSLMRETNYDSPNWDKPLAYRLPGSNPKEVHHTRVLRMVGLEVDDHKRADYNGWGQSWIEACWPSYSDLMTCSSSLATQMHDALFNVLKLNNLPALLSRKEGESLLDHRIETINMGKAMLRTLVLDQSESYEVIASDLSKLIGPYDLFAQALSADSNIPLTIMFGQSPKGFNSTDLNAIESYYEFLETIQEEDLEPVIIPLVNAIMAQIGRTNSQFSVWWPPIEKPDELTAAQVRTTTLQGDLALYSIGVMDAEEIRARHYGSEGFQADMMLKKWDSSPRPLDVELPETEDPVPALAVTEPVTEPAVVEEAAIEDALAGSRPDAKNTMVCVFPPEEWLARFQSMFPGAQPFTHLTLKYCGALTPNETQMLIAELGGVMDTFHRYPQPASVVVAGHGCFFRSGTYCEMLLVAPSPALQSLQASVHYAASGVSAIDSHDFLPHVTINYHDIPFSSLPVESSDFTVWDVAEFCLVQEDEVLDRWSIR